MEKTYYIGLDVGSTTAKIAVIDTDNRVIYSKYERHNARVNELRKQNVEISQNPLNFLGQKRWRCFHPHRANRSL